MSHTKEPWHVAPGGDYCDIVCQDHVDIARTDVEEDARRIVDCVNACAGIESLILRAAAACGGFGRDRMVEAITKQRDELLVALEFACKKISDLHLEAGDGDCHYPIINDAIASVKGGA